MKRILFPTDFSKVATNAFSYALEFANLVDGELLVLHSYDLIPMDSQFFSENFNDLYDSVELANFEQFKKEILKLRSIMKNDNFDNIKISHRLMEGDLFANINKSIQEDKIDYVIMGTSSETEWESLFAGSNSGSVILSLKVPMICIPMEVKFNKIKTIGFINHYTSNDKIAINTLLNIAKITNAKIKCIFINTRNSNIDNEIIEKWKTDFINEPIEFFVVQSNEISEVELQFISNQNIDILGMLTYKSSLFEVMFIPNYSKNKPSEIEIPILVIHA
jgi:nucleotide-binding universal stress UspA family protein